MTGVKATFVILDMYHPCFLGSPTTQLPAHLLDCGRVCICVRVHVCVWQCYLCSCCCHVMNNTHTFLLGWEVQACCLYIYGLGSTPLGKSAKYMTVHSPGKQTWTGQRLEKDEGTTICVLIWIIICLQQLQFITLVSWCHINMTQTLQTQTLGFIWPILLTLALVLSLLLHMLLNHELFLSLLYLTRAALVFFFWYRWG